MDESFFGEYTTDQFKTLNEDEITKSNQTIEFLPIDSYLWTRDLVSLKAVQVDLQIWKRKNMKISKWHSRLSRSHHYLGLV